MAVAHGVMREATPLATAKALRAQGKLACVSCVGAEPAQPQ